MAEKLEALRAEYNKVMQRVCKWRSVFAGWQLGTRSRDDPEVQAVRDQRDATMMMRIELNAMLAILYRNKLVDPEDWLKTAMDEAEHYDKMLERKFPGFKSYSDGMIIYDKEKAVNTTKGWDKLRAGYVTKFRYVEKLVDQKLVDQDQVWQATAFESLHTGDVFRMFEDGVEIYAGCVTKEPQPLLDGNWKLWCDTLPPKGLTMT